MQKHYLIAISLIFAVLLSGNYINTIAAADTSENTSNTSNSLDYINEIPLTILSVQNTVNNIVTIIITGIVKTCSSGDPFEGVTITLKSLSGETLGTTTTDSNGFYQIVLQCSEEMLQSMGDTFQVTASYPGHVPKTQQVTITQDLTNPTDPNYYGSANFTLGTVDVASTKTVTNLNRTGAWYNLDFVSYIIKISNRGDDGATGVVYQDLLPAGLIYVNHTISTNGGLSWVANSSAYNPTSGAWNIGNIAANSIDQIILNITAQINGGGTFYNYANKTAMNEVDSNPTNDNSTATFSVGITEVSVTKLAANYDHPGEQITFGDLIEYTITWYNNAGQATGVVYKDLLPDNVIYINHTYTNDRGVHWYANSSVYNPLTGTINIGTISAYTYNNPKYQLKIIAKVNTPTDDIVNDVNKTSMNEFDRNTGNDNYTCTIWPEYADVASTKTVIALNSTDGNFYFNDLILYTIKISNLGTQYPAMDVVYQDLLPAGLIYINHTISTDGGESWNDNDATYNPNNGNWDIGVVPPGVNDWFILNITARINATNKTFVNWANKTAMRTYDINLLNDNSSANFTVGPAADVSVTKIIDKAKCKNGTTTVWPPIEGVSMYYYITAHNNGPDDATDVVIQDILPAGLTYKNHWVSEDGGITWKAAVNLPANTYNPTTGIWNVGNLTYGGQDKILSIRTIVNTNDEWINNTAAKISQTEYDPDTSNDNSTADVYIPPE